MEASAPCRPVPDAMTRTKSRARGFSAIAGENLYSVVRDVRLHKQCTAGTGRPVLFAAAADDDDADLFRLPRSPLAFHRRPDWSSLSFPRHLRL